MIDDWVTLKSQRVLDTPWFGMRADTCQLSNGNVIEDFYVLEYRDWANVLALTPEQDVVLIKQYRHGLGQTCLELPAGIVDEVHEDREAAALNAIKRELLEETGYGGGQFIPLASLSPNPATHNNLSHAFLALDVTKEALQTLEDSEQIEVVLTPLTKLIELAETGQLRQALHVSTLFLALKKLETLKEET